MPHEPVELTVRGSMSENQEPDASIENSRASVARNTRSMVSSQAATWLLAPILAAAVPRFIGPEGFGQIRIASSIWALVSVILPFGTYTVLTVKFARSTGTEQMFRSALGMECILYLAGAIPIILYTISASYEPQLKWAIILTGISPVFYAYGETSRAVFYGSERMSFPAKIDVLTKVFTVALSLGVLAMGGRVLALIIVSGIVAILYATLMLSGIRHQLNFRISPQFRGIRQVARQGAPFLITELSIVIYRQSDALFLSRLADAAQVGYYSAAETLLGSLLVVPTIALTVLLPALARVSEADPANGLRIVRRGMHTIFIVTVPMGLGVIILGNQIAVILFGNSFRRSGPVLGAMGLVLIVMVPSILIGNYSATIHRQSRWAVITLAAIGASIPLYYILIPWASQHYGNGAFGAALVFAITEAVILVMATILIVPSLWTSELMSGALKACLCGAIMTGATWPLRHAFLPVPLTVGIVTYVAGVFALRALDADESRFIHGAWSKLRSR